MRRLNKLECLSLARLIYIVQRILTKKKSFITLTPGRFGGKLDFKVLKRFSFFITWVSRLD